MPTYLRHRRAVALLATLSTILTAATLGAATIAVNSLEDNTTAGDGLVTLREAILAVMDGSTTDLGQTPDMGAGDSNTINLGGLNGVITLSSSLPSIVMTGRTLIFEGPAIPGDLIISGADSFGLLSASSGTFISNRLVLQGGVRANGGGLVVTGATTSWTANFCRVTECRNTSSDGGGIRVASGASLTLNNCLIDRNSSVEEGGGIDMNSTGSLNIIQTTITGNMAEAGGAGLEVQSGPVLISHSTITNNIAGTGGGNSTFGGGLRISTAAVVTLNNSLIAGNEDLASLTPNDDLTVVGGNLLSQGYNLIGNNTGVELLLAPTDLFGTGASPLDPELLPLASYGGVLPTQMPRPSSPAINAGNPAVTDATAPFPTDARGSGFPRVVGGRVDIGAVELLGSISGIVWEDFRGNGVRELGDNVVAGMELRLLRVADDELVATTTSLSDGTYALAALDGEYYILADVGSGYLTTLPDQGADDLDSDFAPGYSEGIVNSTGSFTISGQTNIANVDLGLVPEDGDGVASIIELNVPSHPDSSIQPTGDGNGDDIYDFLQFDVASFESFGTRSNPGMYVTLASPDGGVLGSIMVFPAPDPLPNGVTFPIGLIDFTLSDGSFPTFPDFTIVKMYLERVPDPVPNSYFKYDPDLEEYVLFDSFSPGVDPGAVRESGREYTLYLYDSDGSIPFAVGGDAHPAPGNLRDPGGPAFSIPLLVQFETMSASLTPEGVRIDWTTLSEINNAGFNVYTLVGTDRVLLTPTLIPSATIDGGGASYSFLHGNAQGGWYYIEDIDLNGKSSLHGPFALKLTTQTEDWQLF